MKTQAKPLAFVIEDDNSLADIFTQAVKMADFETQTAANGQQAIDMLANLEPALVILDLYLPRVSGEQVLAYIRNDSRLRKVIVILTTFDSILADSLREQCDFVLLKPVGFSQLLDLAVRLRATIE